MNYLEINKIFAKINCSLKTAETKFLIGVIVNDVIFDKNVQK